MGSLLGTLCQAELIVLPLGGCLLEAVHESIHCWLVLIIVIALELLRAARQRRTPGSHGYSPLRRMR